VRLHLHPPAGVPIFRAIAVTAHAGLASQAVGPPLSDREMGSLGRTFKDIGKRLGPAKPLKKSVLLPPKSNLPAKKPKPKNKPSKQKPKQNNNL